MQSGGERLGLSLSLSFPRSLNLVVGEGDIRGKQGAGGGL